ncbi:MAG: ornithine cyclodeaminase family protein [Rhodobacteraceae bacterium]|nr:ornithine cyclodeaminase family protein [Paracoccaceae bacterium]
MIILSSAEVARLLPMKQAIDLMEKTMIDVADGKATLPLRSALAVGGGNHFGIMPGVLSAGGIYGVKALSLFPGNPARGLSSHVGAMVLFDPETGAPSAVMNADAITAIRTAAASAAATRALARPDARKMAVIGTGEQAETHIRAIRLVRDITEVRIAGRNKGRAEAFVDRMRMELPGVELVACYSVFEATQRADIITTVTSSSVPVLKAAQVPPGCHVNAVGASVPSMQEIDSDIVLGADVFVDYLPSALAQARDIMDPLADGRMQSSHIKGEIGAVFAGRIAARSAPEAVTLYRSLGVAAQDLAAAAMALANARAEGQGVEVPLH